MKKATAVALCALAALCASGAMKWKNFDDKSHLSGPKLTEDDLLGKAVLLYYWDAADEASVKYLPEVEKVWNSFKTKKFAVIGTYGGAKDEAKIKAAVEKGKVTFPVYYKFDMDPPPTHWKTPYFCVINHRGTVVYSGAGMKDATQKSVEAMTAIGMPVSLCGDVTFKKFKPRPRRSYPRSRARGTTSRRTSSSTARLTPRRPSSSSSSSSRPGRRTTRLPISRRRSRS